MPKHERIKIGVIIPSSREGYLLEITYFTSVHLISREYLMDGDQERTFESRGAALGWAVDQERCGHVVYSALDDDHCSIFATIHYKAFFNIRPAKVLLTA